MLAEPGRRFMAGFEGVAPRRGEMPSEEPPISLESRYCSACLVCASSCPFEAFSREEETGEITIDIEKCQVCGVCYSGCPAGAIRAAYYSFDSLIHYLEGMMKPKRLRTMVLTCRGSVPSDVSLKDIVSFPDFIPLYVPCVGRVPVEFFLKTVSMGVEKIVVAMCREKYCHYKDGSSICKLKLALLRSLVQQLGYSTDTFRLETLGSFACVDETKCALCLTCLRVCKSGAPFFDRTEAIKVEIDVEKCSGCGVCVGECPAKAMELRYGRI